MTAPSREFLDTNILIYAHDLSPGQETKRHTAISLIRRLMEDRRACISVQVLQEFYVAVTRKIGRPLPSQEALEAVEDFMKWPLHEPSAEDVRMAVLTSQRRRLSLRDALIVHSAASLGCCILWSEDLNAGQLIEGVRISTPFSK